jgi:hypothetical protein
VVRNGLDVGSDLIHRVGVVPALTDGYAIPGDTPLAEDQYS